MKRLLTRTPAVLVCVFTLSWALVELVASAASVSAYEIVWTRYGVHLLLMALLFGPRHKFRFVRTRRLGREIVTSLLMLGMPLCFILAMQHASAQDVSVAFWIAPALLVGFAMVAGRPYGGAATWLAVAAGLLGAVLICKPDMGVFRPGALITLGMAGCFALYVVLVGSMREDPILTKLFHTALWVFVALSLALPAFWRTPSLRGLGAMTLVGILGWVGLYSLDLAIESLPIAVLAPVLYTQLTWDMLLRWPLHMMSPDASSVVGVLLTALAAMPGLVSHKRRNVLAAGAQS